jgi:uncharacterized protein (UPF0335 family)
MNATPNFAKEQLVSVVERLERLDAQKQAIMDDFKEVLKEAKGNGFDVKIIRECLKLRKMDPHELSEREAMLDLYRSALGMAD